MSVPGPWPHLGACTARDGPRGAHAPGHQQGRTDAFYGGELSDGLLEVGQGWFGEMDLAASRAEWVMPLSTTVWGVDLWTCPANSHRGSAPCSAATEPGHPAELAPGRRPTHTLLSMLATRDGQLEAVSDERGWWASAADPRTVVGSVPGT